MRESSQVVLEELKCLYSGIEIMIGMRSVIGSVRLMLVKEFSFPMKGNIPTNRTHVPAHSQNQMTSVINVVTFHSVNITHTFLGLIVECMVKKKPVFF